MKVLHAVRGHFWCFVEQPAQSWAYKLPQFEELITLLGLLPVQLIIFRTLAG